MHFLEEIKKLKQEFKKEGFIIEGVFGSYARGEATKQSDIDILYSLEEKFYKEKGFEAIIRLNEIKEYLAKKLKTPSVDLAPKNALSKTAKKYILKEIIYV